MEINSRNGRFSSRSRRQDSSITSRSDLCLGFEEFDAEDGIRAEIPCPFCDEDLDVVVFSLHMEEEHPVEAKMGVGMDLIEQLTMQHGSFFKVHDRRRTRRGAVSSSTLALLKEMKDERFRARLSGASHGISSSNAVADPLLSSFINSLTIDDASGSMQPSHHVDEGGLLDKSPDNSPSGKSSEPPISEKDKEERAQRSKFVQELVLSTIFLGDDES